MVRHLAMSLRANPGVRPRRPDDRLARPTVMEADEPNGDIPATGPALARLLLCQRTQLSLPRGADSCIGRMMRRPNRARLMSDPTLLLSSGIGLLVRHARASGGWLLLTRWPSGKRFE